MEDGTTQIDHVIVPRYGIIVIETKNMNGWVTKTATPCIVHSNGVEKKGDAMHKVILMILLAEVSNLAIAEIYKAVDEKGHVTYSSVPINGGKKVYLEPLSPNDWEPAMSSKSNNITYVSASSIIKKDNKANMWSLTDFRSAKYYGQKQYISQKDFREFDCNRMLMRVIFGSIHSENMGRGEVVESESVTQPWEPVLPGSIGEVLKKIACGELLPH